MFHPLFYHLYIQMCRRHLLKSDMKFYGHEKLISDSNTAAYLWI